MPPTLSVIVPAYQSAEMLRACLNGLLASTLPRAAWELIVVDDGSTDDTSAVAAGVADTVLRVVDGPRGPAHARNVGAKSAGGEYLLFVDADVVVAPTTLQGVVDRFGADPTIAAIFGAYDASPTDSGLVSQYRNLVHRYVHLQHVGDNETFWAGCGAVRRDVFLALGGFDAARYPRPQIEDIELGYRLRADGHRIVLDPAIAGTHLKRWTLSRMVRADLLDRAIPWMHLLLQRRVRRRHSPSLTRRDKFCTAVAGIGALAVSAALLSGNPVWMWSALGAALVIVAGDARLFAWFAGIRGWPFALATIPLRILFYVVSAAGGTIAILTNARQVMPSVLPPLSPASTGLPDPRPSGSGG